MSIANFIGNIFTPTFYKSVEEYAGDADIDLAELKSSTMEVFVKEGKVEAIKHINRTISPQRPLPLTSTYRFVNKITNVRM